MFEPDTEVVTDYGPEGLDAAKLVSSFENVPNPSEFLACTLNL